MAAFEQSPARIGMRVDASPARWPEPTILVGQRVTLKPFDRPTQAAELYRATHGGDREDLWRYLPDGPFPDQATFDAFFERMKCSEDRVFLAILDNVSGRALGWAAYLQIVPVHRSIEVGYILYSPALRRTVGATEAMYLMARYAFEDLGYRRYEWKCNALNEASKNAALRLGFRYEGVFRQHMIVKGRNRDTAWFSMLDSEWPSRKAAFEHWLSPENFDQAGVQKRSLSSMNREGNAEA
ncbi:MAG TPA: GNAT family protein [Acidobacteriaceae bacterium]|jgi:RimJ/RimL family protein N-acetyltransferase